AIKPVLGGVSRVIAWRDIAGSIDMETAGFLRRAAENGGRGGP
ncbi:hypothetical protein A2U01_0109316, partial [Trifolium medium]|nr:hypothetical protein [Trifolium medium]